MPEVLKNPQFLKLWGNQILLQVGFNMCNYTALLIIANATHSPFIQAQFYAALILPGALLGIIAGPIVDIVNRKNLMLFTDILLALLFLCYALVSSQVYLMITVAFLTAIVASFFTPAEAASLPIIVKQEDLNHANSFFLFTLFGSVLLGYSLAGPVIQFFGGLSKGGANVPFLISSVILIIGFFLRLSLRQIETVKPTIPTGAFFLKPIKLFLQTITEVYHKKHLLFPIILLIFVEFMVGVMSVLLIEYVRRYLQLPLETISYILIGPLIIGLIIGISILSTLERKYGNRLLIYASLLIIGSIIALLGILPPHISLSYLRDLTILAAVAVGISLVFVAVKSRTLLQVATPSSMQGRVFSLLSSMTALATPFPVLLLGFSADRISLLTTIAAIGVFILLVSFFANLLYKKSFS